MQFDGGSGFKNLFKQNRHPEDGSGSYKFPLRHVTQFESGSNKRFVHRRHPI